jgi:hypothetical protein
MHSVFDPLLAFHLAAAGPGANAFRSDGLKPSTAHRAALSCALDLLKWSSQDPRSAGACLGAAVHMLLLLAGLHAPGQTGPATGQSAERCSSPGVGPRSSTWRQLLLGDGEGQRGVT